MLEIEFLSRRLMENALSNSGDEYETTDWFYCSWMIATLNYKIVFYEFNEFLNKL